MYSTTFSDYISIYLSLKYTRAESAPFSSLPFYRGEARIKAGLYHEAIEDTTTVG